MLYTRAQVEAYIPHSGSMVLLDRVIEHGSEYVVTEVDVDARLPCYLASAVPAYLGIEIMAQSIAVWAGMVRGDPHTRPPIGYLLGTRRFESAVSHFPEGSTLKTQARLIVAGEGLAMFACEIDQQAAAATAYVKVATANLSVYSVPETSK